MTGIRGSKNSVRGKTIEGKQAVMSDKKRITGKHLGRIWGPSASNRTALGRTWDWNAFQLCPSNPGSQGTARGDTWG